MLEMGIDAAEIYAWQAMMAPASTPSPVIARLNEELVRILGSQETRTKFLAKGAEPISSTPGEVTAYIRKEMALWHPLIKELGIKLD